MRKGLQIVAVIIALLGVIARVRNGIAIHDEDDARDLVADAPRTTERVAVAGISFVVPASYARLTPELARQIDAEIDDPGLVSLATRYPLVVVAREERGGVVMFDELISAGPLGVDNDPGSIDAGWCAQQAADLAAETHRTLHGSALLPMPMGVACQIRLTRADAPNWLLITSVIIHAGIDVQVTCEIDVRDAGQRTACDAVLSSAAVGQ